ncbi:MAG: formate--tetrahydrofolate ligase [Gaiellaceae bacterium MAG52_C11]|nr:formate--tetrahydrofolate ligase [Candidatus Gaiellasilicea maunaloa]
MTKTEMPSSLEIAQAAQLRPIVQLAKEAGLLAEEVEQYGRHKAKVDLSVLERLADTPDGKLICVTAITPTKAGEGKTTTSVSLTQGLGAIGKRPVLCLREASVGPVFGIKGGAAGGGYTQVVPMEDLNLHFTGDLHAIGAANNLLAALLESHLLHGNALGIDPLSISWRRCVDMNDRALRQIVVGLGGRTNGYVRETGFDITAASEVMAIVAVARDLFDLRRRLGAITVGHSFNAAPITAEALNAAGAMTVLLKDALKPNLVQTLEGQPALVHCGPFANIAHGNNSLVADLVALKLGDYVVTESGFGSDMGMEKFLNIVCRAGGLSPSAVVLVATVRALEHHGDEPGGGLAAIERGSANLRRHLEIVHGFGLKAVVAVNRFPGDTDEEVELVRRLALDYGAHAAELNEGFERGGAGAAALAEAVVDATREAPSFDHTYPIDAPIEKKIRAIATRVYGADDIFLLKTAREKIEAFTAAGLDRLPICMAKTHLSLSHDASLANAPEGFTVSVRDIRAYTGAGWLVALCGDMQTMPGLAERPAAFTVDIDEDGRTVGLF